MKVILNQDITGVGKREEIINVADGYFRNYLAPRKLAVPAEGSALAEWQKRRKAEEARSERTAEDAKEIAARLEGVQLIIKHKVGTGTKLYGSITPAEIAEELQKQKGIKIDKRKIEMDEPIKTLGSHEVPVHLHRDTIGHIKLEVVGE